MNEANGNETIFILYRVMKYLVIFLFLVVFVGLASLLTTFGEWYGILPTGEFRLHVRDVEGNPVKGAKLQIYRGGTREPAAFYALKNRSGGPDLVSDDKGVITGIRDQYRGFGGNTWKLFWVIPLGDRVPEYDGEITAEGFKPLKFPASTLSRSPYRSYEDFPKTRIKKDGKEVELKIYEHSFTLER